MFRNVGDHAPSLFFGVIFLVSLFGQSLTGLAMYNEEQAEHGSSPVTYPEFITSSQFIVDVAENWQSEYLQFFLFILVTIWLVQKGSTESKQPGDDGIGTAKEQLVGEYATADSPSWAKAGGWRQVLYSNSLLIVMGAIFVFSWLAQSLSGMVVYNEEQLQHQQPVVDWAGYIASSDFWNRTLQNWQSEFLAVGSMAAFTI
ncbi:DUF6766 family protein [Lysobacter korlensis]|uniref:DUF6766 family protein n=1 Tax=Lysobacter korlensis TaxID=553636 RepID=A0ABV6RVS6_9GAMM